MYFFTSSDGTADALYENQGTIGTNFDLIMKVEYLVSSLLRYILNLILADIVYKQVLISHLRMFCACIGDKIREFLRSLSYFRIFIGMWNILVILGMIM